MGDLRLKEFRPLSAAVLLLLMHSSALGKSELIACMENETQKAAAHPLGLTEYNLRPTRLCDKIDPSSKGQSDTPT